MVPTPAFPHHLPALPPSSPSHPSPDTQPFFLQEAPLISRSILAVPGMIKPRTLSFFTQAPQVVRKGGLRAPYGWLSSFKLPWKAWPLRPGSGEGDESQEGSADKALCPDGGKCPCPPQRQKSPLSLWWCPSPGRRGTSKPQQQRSESCGYKACRPRSLPACRAAAALKTRSAQGPEWGGTRGWLVTDQPPLASPVAADSTGESECSSGCAGRPYSPRQQLLH